MKKLSTINRNDLLLCTGLLLAALCIWCAIFFGAFLTFFGALLTFLGALLTFLGALLTFLKSGSTPVFMLFNHFTTPKKNLPLHFSLKNMILE